MTTRMRRASAGVPDTSRKVPEAWVVRGEQEGRDEAFNLRECVASINWNDFPNPFTNEKAALEAHAQRWRHGPDAPGQIWQFVHDIHVGALIIMPRLHPQHRSEVAIGWCEGPAYPVLCVSDATPNLRLPVRWIVANMPRGDFSAATQRRYNSPHHTVSRIVSEEVVADIVMRLTHVEAADEIR